MQKIKVQSFISSSEIKMKQCFICVSKTLIFEKLNSKYRDFNMVPFPKLHVKQCNIYLIIQEEKLLYIIAQLRAGMTNELLTY